MRIRHFAAALLLLGTAPAAAIAQGAAEQRRFDWALERGRLLFALDRAAWVATDDMVARLRDPVAAGVNGFVVSEVANRAYTRSCIALSGPTAQQLDSGAIWSDASAAQIRGLS